GEIGDTNTYSGVYFASSSVDNYFVNTLFTNPDGDQKYGIETNGSGNRTYQLNCLFSENATDGFLEASGSTIRNLDTISRSLTIGKLAYSGDAIYESETDSDPAAVAFNYNGYQGGTSRYRDFKIFNGKNEEVLVIE